jgi:cell wall-associated NlpC family hydrolase
VSDLEPRLHAFRPDLADARLKGRVSAARFVEGAPRRVVASAAPLKRRPAADAPLDSEVLRGEVFTVFETTADGWSWGQLETDGYVGYVPGDALSPSAPPPTHRVSALRTFVYPDADMKLPPRTALSFGAVVAIDRETETRGTRYLGLAGGEGWIGAPHLSPVGAPPAGDFVAVAERFLEVSYLWGGRTSLGLDCSALVQLSLAAAGHSAPRDSDLQEKMLGEKLERGLAEAKRGDLVFWRGHVAILIDGEYIVHASGSAMTVIIEALADAIARIGPPISVRRVS